jgi:hypothetical protein
MNTDKKKTSAPKSDPCSSASIRGYSFILFRRGTRKTFTSLKIADKVAILGQERVTDTARLAVHGLSGDIKQGNTYYEDLQNCVEFSSPQPTPTGRGNSDLPSPAGRRDGDAGSTTDAIGRFDFVLAKRPFGSTTTPSTLIFEPKA